MSDEIYLDANATVRPLECVVEAVTAAMREAWGNPSSEHANGNAARRVLARARDAAAALLPGINPEDVVLTSGGTEVSNTILAAAGPDSTLIVSAVEHPATMRPAERARNRGANLIVVPVDAQGQADPDAFAQAALRAPTRSVYASVQWANGETGVIQPVAAISTAIHAVRPDAIIHVDAAQADGKNPHAQCRAGSRGAASLAISFTALKEQVYSHSARVRMRTSRRSSREAGKSEGGDPGRRTSLARRASEQRWRHARRASRQPSSECGRCETGSRREFSRPYRTRWSTAATATYHEYPTPRISDSREPTACGWSLNSTLQASDALRDRPAHPVDPRPHTCCERWESTRKALTRALGSRSRYSTRKKRSSARRTPSADLVKDKGMMQTSGSPTRFEFGRHETFPVRHGWLAKGLGRVRETGRYDGDLETADALGLGSRMAKSLAFWLEASGLAGIESNVTNRNRETPPKGAEVEDHRVRQHRRHDMTLTLSTP